MKALHTIIIAIASIVTLSGCSGAADKGERAAKQLIAAWGNPDAVRQMAEDYAQMRDSLAFGMEEPMMTSAVREGVSRNDTMLIVAQAIALSVEEMGNENAKAIVDGLSKGTLDAQAASARLGAIGTALAMLNRSDDLPKVLSIIDKHAQQLPEQEQMKVYARSCSPRALGDAMRQERATDSIASDRRAHIVEGILQGEELETFKEHYYKR